MGFLRRSTDVTTAEEPLGSKDALAIAGDSDVGRGATATLPASRGEKTLTQGGRLEEGTDTAVTGDVVGTRTVAARRAQTVIVAAAITVVVAAFLPWASFLGFSKSGIEGDGQVTLVLGLLGLLLVWRRWLGWIAQAVLAGIVALASLYDLSNAGSLAAIGLYLTFFAGGAWVVGALMARAARSA